MNQYISDLMKAYSKDCYAHKITSTDRETLEDHSLLTLNYLKFFNQDNSFKNVISKVYDKISFELLEYTLFLHDMGKKNPRFQSKNMNNNTKNKSYINRVGDSNHSLLGSLCYISLMFELYLEKLDKAKDFLHIAEIIDNAYMIFRHHTNLSIDFKSFIVSLKNCQNENWVEDIFDEYDLKPLSEDDFYIIEQIYGETKPNIMKKQKNELFIYLKSRLTYSLLVNCDSLATREFYTGIKENFDLYKVLDVNKYFSGSLYTSIQEYAKGNKEYDEDDINKIRTEIALEVESNITTSKSSLLFLEAPCGAGKTNVGLLSACNLIRKDESLRGLVYTSPFNAITDQNVAVFRTYFNDLKDKDNNIQVINSTSAINTVGYADDENEKLVLDYQIHNNAFIATSHVHLFNILFGLSRADLLSLIFLSNRVIILDEVQAYTPAVWKFMIEMLSIYSDYLNIKFVIMSATLPDLSTLLENDDSKIENLIKNKKKYFDNPLFKNRVVSEYIGHINLLETIIKEESFYNGKKVLYEFIKKGTAQKFYELITEAYPSNEIYLLDGDCNVTKRKEIISRTNNVGEIIIVSTQVIEAGTDLDFDVGFKDISIPDSEIQFLGRINRSCKRSGHAIFFDFDNKNIYQKDPRIDSSIAHNDIFEAVKNFDNIEIYEKTLNYIKDISDYKHGKFSFDVFKSNCGLLNFLEISKSMRVIEETANIYVAHKLTMKDIFNDSDDDKDELIMLYGNLCEISDKYDLQAATRASDDLILDGKVIWELEDRVKSDSSLSYTDRFLQLKIIKQAKMYFMYTFYVNDKNIPCDIELKYGTTYYTDNDNYIVDGKLDREKLKESNFL